jgi:23S rRNA pseudouridine1911/1915/1917 synthase
VSETSITAPSRAAGERLDVFLAQALAQPRSQVQKLLKSDLIRVNGRAERPSYIMQPGDVVERLEAPAAATAKVAPDLPVVYEDADILVVDKPAGLAVHPGAAGHTTATVADFARPLTEDADPDRPGIVHRLDRDTSGLLIIAKHAAAKAYMQEQFKQRLVHKTYILVVVGRVAEHAARYRRSLSSA